MPKRNGRREWRGRSRSEMVSHDRGILRCCYFCAGVGALRFHRAMLGSYYAHDECEAEAQRRAAVALWGFENDPRNDGIRRAFAGW